MNGRIGIVALALLTSACAHYTVVGPERRPIADLYSVEPQQEWNRAMEDEVEIWTIDGPLLEALRFINGLEDGDTLIKVDDEKTLLPRFRAHMTPTEIMEFCVGSIRLMAGGVETASVARGWMPSEGIRTASINAASIEATGLRPMDFGGLSGFRFDLRFLSKEGLRREGLVAGTVHEGRLYLIVYSGASEHYFSTHREAVERLIASVRIER